jgi:hypothetical protein
MAEHDETIPEDDGGAIHYSAVKPGTAVYGSDGPRVGTVRQILDNYEEHIFDGVVFEDLAGTLRFADAPEVSRTAERCVVLAVSAEKARRLGPPEDGPGTFVPRRAAGGRLGKLLGRGWKRR